MLEKLQDFFLNKALGRIAVRVAVSLCAYLASGKMGATLTLDPAEVSAALITAVNVIVTALKPRVKVEAPAAPVAPAA